MEVEKLLKKHIKENGKNKRKRDAAAQRRSRKMKKLRATNEVVLDQVRDVQQRIDLALEDAAVPDPMFQLGRSRIGGNSGMGVFVSKAAGIIPKGYILPIAGEVKDYEPGKGEKDQRNCLVGLSSKRWLWGYRKYR